MADADNPFFRPKPAQPHRAGYGSPEYLAQANIRCTRPELEWFYDNGGNMQLRYKRKRYGEPA